MPSSTGHRTPSSYALERAVRVASRRLGKTASIADIEQEALRLLADDGYMPVSTDLSNGSLLERGLQQRIDQLEPVGPVTFHVSISAAVCASRQSNTQRARLYDLLRKELLSVPDALRKSVHLHVRETSALFVGHHPDAVLTIAETLADVARDIPVAGISGPFIDAALTENLPLIEHLPELLGLAGNVCPTVQVGTQENGHPEAALVALSFALAVAGTERSGTKPVLLSLNDCDRRAFGHRVHPETVVMHAKSLASGQPSPLPERTLKDTWQAVTSADLPLIPGAPPERTTDHVYTLLDANPESIRHLLEEHLLAGAAIGARRQLLLMC